MAKISVIMPSLNVGKYIRECMESVVQQSYADLEIIVIDAGSTDGTLEILEEYTAKDERVKLIHSEKRSYGYQMNQGIAMATGEYIGIVETDDVIDKDMFSKLYSAIEGTDADYVKACAREFYAIGNKKEYNTFIRSCSALQYSISWINQVTLVPRDNPVLFWDDNFLWYGMYRSSFLKNVEFSETAGAAFQDIGALFQIIFTARKAIYIKDVVYFYRRSNGEASSYNAKSFNFALYEYDKIHQQYYGQMNLEWRHIYYKKMLGLFINRFYFMSASETFWEESVPGMKGVLDKLQRAFDENYLNSCYVTELDLKKYQMACENLKKLYEFEYECIMKNKAPYDKIRTCCENKRVVIFGAGRYGAYINTYLMFKSNCEILGFVDNLVDKWGTIYEDRKVFGLDVAKTLGADIVYVIANKRYSAEIREQLLNEGIMEEHIVIYDALPVRDILMYN